MSEEEEKEHCSYCLQGGEDENPLIQLNCNCKNVYWHKDCATTWVRSIHRDNGKKKCLTCNEVLKMKLKRGLLIRIVYYILVLLDFIRTVITWLNGAIIACFISQLIIYMSTPKCLLYCRDVMELGFRDPFFTGKMILMWLISLPPSLLIICLISAVSEELIMTEFMTSLFSNTSTSMTYEYIFVFIHKLINSKSISGDEAISYIYSLPLIMIILEILRKGISRIASKLVEIIIK